MDKAHVFIFMGRSGSGKGTQIKLLQNYLAEKNPEMAQQNFACGDQFREFFKTESYLSKRVQVSVTEGNYQPDFFATTLFFNHVFKTINDTDHLFFDGYPRSLKQLDELKELLAYVGKTHATVIDISVTADEVVKRLLLRTGRADDTEAGARKRQAEFDQFVVPVLEKMKQDSFFTCLTIDGMPSPEDVHASVVRALSL